MTAPVELVRVLAAEQMMGENGALLLCHACGADPATLAAGRDCYEAARLAFDALIEEIVRPLPADSTLADQPSFAAAIEAAAGRRFLWFAYVGQHLPPPLRDRPPISALGDDQALLEVMHSLNAAAQLLNTQWRAATAAEQKALAAIVQRFRWRPFDEAAASAT